ncbi:TPA: HAD family hydrolase [Candidatus Bathyarchaeota archaeon]|nr:HAD family hydrolase [Candidatus Bathyarchaeota archaeon]
MFGVSMPVKAVIFDLDETLIHSNIDFKRMKERVITFLERNGVTRGLLNLRMLNVEITRLAVKDLQEKGFSEDQIKEIFSQVTKIMNQIEIESLDGARPIDGAFETLSYLKKKGIKIGVMTRSCREYTERALSKSGLKRFVDVISARDDVDKPKPDPEHARHVLKLLGVKAEDAVFVGDHWLDCLCAKKAGLRFILVSRKDFDKKTPAGHDFENVKDIKEIMGKI